MASKDTGFHHSDADWTRGRAQAIAAAESIVRKELAMTRKVCLTRKDGAVIINKEQKE